MQPKLTQFLQKCEQQHAAIAENRKRTLELLADTISGALQKQGYVNIIAICTHNSRRSQMTEAGLKVMAEWYNIDHINPYSGGTEATAVASPVISTLENIGLQCIAVQESSNTLWALRSGEKSQPQCIFSKTYDHTYNPASNFIALMTCASADQNCPYIPEAVSRISLTYEDPKKADGKEEESEQYELTIQKIFTEISYTFNRVKQQLHE